MLCRRIVLFGLVLCMTTLGPACSSSNDESPTTDTGPPSIDTGADGKSGPPGMAVCGNGKCENGEDSTTCSVDCDECGANGVYESAGFPKVWEGDPSNCDPPCQQSFDEFCGVVDDGAVDDDKKGVGVTLCNPAYPCTNGGTGTPSMCTCSPPPPPGCAKFNISAPEPDCDNNLPGPANGACDFYQDILTQKFDLGCTEEEKKEFFGYHETCTNVSQFAGSPTPSGASCDNVDVFRKYVDRMRYCLQKEMRGQVVDQDGCIKSGLKCSDLVIVLRNAHPTCNADPDATDCSTNGQNYNFCTVMADPDAGYCFGYSLGLAWGAFFSGNTPAGPFQPLGTALTLVSTATCGTNAILVSNNVCAGYRDGCAARAGANPGEFDVGLCAISCPHIGIP